MAATLPFGLRDVKITPIAADGTLGTPIDLPNSQTFSFSEGEDFEELRGDDRTVTTRGKGASVDWELEAGGIDLAAWKALAGGTITTTGTGGTAVTTYSKKSRDSRPFFKVEGQALSDSGGDFHAVLYKCRANDSLEGKFEDGSFWISSAKGTALGKDDTDNLYDFVQNAAVTSIPTS